MSIHQLAATPLATPQQCHAVRHWLVPPLLRQLLHRLLAAMVGDAQLRNIAWLKSTQFIENQTAKQNS